MIRWNCKRLESIYNTEIGLARKTYSHEELERVDLARLSHQTKSCRIMQMIELAYTVGELESIKEYGEKKEKEFWYTWTIEREQPKYKVEKLSEYRIEELLKTTKSTRITRMVKLAYTLGKLRGILTLNEGKTKITVPKLFI